MDQQVAQLTATMAQLQQTVANQTAELNVARQEAATARQEAAVSAARSGLVDTRLLGKPKSFDGTDESWASFATVMRAYIGAISPDLLAAMVAAESETGPIVQSSLDQANQQRSTQLYFILVMLLEGRAQDKVPRVGHGAGLELWRLLAAEYEGKQPSRQAGMLQSILSYSFDVNNLNGSLERWERQVKQWETSTGKVLDDTLKIGIVIKAMPKESSMSQHLVMNSARFTTYSVLRAEMVEILMAQRALSAPTAMDVGALGKKGGKKGGKGAGKGGGKDGKTCYVCGAPGHLAQDCCFSGGRK